MFCAPAGEYLLVRSGDQVGDPITQKVDKEREV